MSIKIKLKWFFNYLFKRHKLKLPKDFLVRKYTPTKAQKAAGFLGLAILDLTNYQLSYTRKFGIIKVTNKYLPEDDFTFNFYGDKNAKLFELYKDALEEIGGYNESLQII